jgi:hypothetical protein
MKRFRVSKAYCLPPECHVSGEYFYYLPHNYNISISITELFDGYLSRSVCQYAITELRLPRIFFLIYLQYCINLTDNTAINQIQQDDSESNEMEQSWHVCVLADHKKHSQDSWERELAP